MADGTGWTGARSSENNTAYTGDGRDASAHKLIYHSRLNVKGSPRTALFRSGLPPRHGEGVNGCSLSWEIGILRQKAKAVESRLMKLAEPVWRLCLRHDSG